MDRTRGDLLVLAAQANEQLVRFEMLMPGEELVIKGLPLGRQLQATAFEVFAEDLAFSETHAIATQSQLRYSLVSPGSLTSPRPGGRRRHVAGFHDRSARRERDVPCRGADRGLLA